MKVTSTIHNHCTLCDGRSSLDEMVNGAIEAGFTDFGMSCHSYMDFDPEYSIKDEKEYVTAIRAKAEECKDKINLYCGIEQDFYAPVANADDFDYIIGSVHYIYDENSKRYFALDVTKEEFIECAKTAFYGEKMGVVRKYFDLVAENAEKYHPDVIGHFDLIVSQNKDNCLFDEFCAEYICASLSALARCVATGAIIEVNTGMITRGLRDATYPSLFLLKRLNAMEGKVMLSSDCHDVTKLTGGFDTAIKVIKEAGFTKLSVFEKGAFVEKPI